MNYNYAVQSIHTVADQSADPLNCSSTGVHISMPICFQADRLPARQLSCPLAHPIAHPPAIAHANPPACSLVIPTDIQLYANPHVHLPVCVSADSAARPTSRPQSRQLALHPLQCQTCLLSALQPTNAQDYRSDRLPANPCVRKSICWPTDLPTYSQTRPSARLQIHPATCLLIH